MIAGCLLYAIDYRVWFSLHGYRIEAQSQTLERRLWEVFPKRCLTFWPYLLGDSKAMKEFLERDMPVIVDTHMESFGNFTTKIDWIRAWLKVEWRGNVWCISKEGKMWLYDPGRPTDEEAGRLVWKIPDQESDPQESQPHPQMYGVFTSPIDTEVIASFLEEFRTCKWFEAAQEITWERRAGMNLFFLKLSHNLQKFELYLQREKYSGQDIGTMIDDMYKGLILEGGNHIIDATYEGKILLRKL
ncbi:MAG: hypothetical protein II954_04735 [Synergistaceae bacterium]|nr:hypothetical protein [Synergistaceae bacterium]